MATLVQDILPYRLKRKQWEAPLRYTFTISQEKSIRNEQSSLRCTIPITLTMVKLYKKSAVFRLLMKLPRFDGSRDYDKLQWVFAKLMSLSRDLHLRTYPVGTIWEILNKKHIQKRWATIRQQILDMYADPLIKNIISRQEQNLMHHFDSLYKQDSMLQFLFNDLFHGYTENKNPQTEKILTRHLGNTPFPIIEQKKLTQVSCLKKQAVIETEGLANMDRIDQQAIDTYLGSLLGKQPGASYHFSCEGQYQINTDYGYIREAYLEITGTLNEAYEKHTKYHLKRTDYE